MQRKKGADCSKQPQIAKWCYQETEEEQLDTIFENKGKRFCIWVAARKTKRPRHALHFLSGF